MRIFRPRASNVPVWAEYFIRTTMVLVTACYVAVAIVLLAHV